MILVGFFMLRRRNSEGDPDVNLNAANAPKLVGLGLFSGALAGFFGIGGGFLIVPGLILATGMPTINAVGSSLLSVAAFGATTAANYAAAGWVDWVLSASFIAGGVVGGFFGVRLAGHLARQRGRLNVLFAGIIFLVAAYMIYRSLGALQVL